MRLAIVTNTPFRESAQGLETLGGDGHYFSGLAKFIDEVWLFLPQAPIDRPLGYHLTENNIQVIPLPIFHKEYDGYLRLPKILRRLSSMSKCDLVNVRLPSLHGILGYGTARRLDKPVFASIVGDTRQVIEASDYHGVRRLLGRIIATYHEKTIQHIVERVPAITNGSLLFEQYNSGAHALYQTVTTTLTEDVISPRADSCQTDTINLLFVGQVIRAKGVPTLIETVRRLASQSFSTHLDIVGDGQIEEMKALARFHAVTPFITFHGHLHWGPDLFERYRAADIFVFPTVYGEGTPRVILEAMSQGLPVIASQIAGIPDVVVDQENGLLIPPGSVEEMTSQIITVVHNDKLRKNLITEAIRTARQHTLHNQTQRMLDNLAPHFPQINTGRTA
jgi:glycosyltransferase involved in cell wall biosynthesis